MTLVKGTKENPKAEGKQKREKRVMHDIGSFFVILLHNLLLYLYQFFNLCYPIFRR